VPEAVQRADMFYWRDWRRGKLQLKEGTRGLQAEGSFEGLVLLGSWNKEGREKKRERGDQLLGHLDGENLKWYEKGRKRGTTKT